MLRRNVGSECALTSADTDTACPSVVRAIFKDFAQDTGIECAHKVIRYELCLHTVRTHKFKSHLILAGDVDSHVLLPLGCGRRPSRILVDLHHQAPQCLFGVISLQRHGGAHSKSDQKMASRYQRVLQGRIFQVRPENGFRVSACPLKGIV